MDNYGLNRMASKASIFVGAILTLAKIYAAYRTQSLSVISSLFDSSLDTVASIGSLIAITMANRPANSHFQFGYGKLEAVSALIQAVLIIVSVFFLIGEAVGRLFKTDTAILHAEIGIIVMGFSIILTLGLMFFQQYVIKKTNSIVIKADALHYMTDLAVNAIVMASLFISPYYPYADSFASIGLSFYILWITRHLIGESLSVLLDQEINDQDKQALVMILRQHPSVLGFHNFRTRTSGKRIFIEVHIDLDPQLTLIESHTISHEIKASVEAVYPNAQMIIHQDPLGQDSLWGQEKF